MCHSVAAFFIPWFPSLPLDVGSLCGLHPSSKSALSLVRFGCPRDLASIDVFVDGSGGDRVCSIAAWGFAVLFHASDGELFFGGILGSRVTTVPWDGGFVGASAPSALYAELTAQVWASAWLLQVTGPLQCSSLPAATIYYDSKSAAAHAMSTAFPLDYRGCPRLSRGLHALLDSRCRLSHCHVAAHCGHPWNELAAAVARSASRGILQFAPLSSPLDVFLCGSLRAVEWTRVFDRGASLALVFDGYAPRLRWFCAALAFWLAVFS